MKREPEPCAVTLEFATPSDFRQWKLLAAKKYGAFGHQDQGLWFLPDAPERIPGFLYALSVFAGKLKGGIANDA